MVPLALVPMRHCLLPPWKILGSICFFDLNTKFVECGSVMCLIGWLYIHYMTRPLLQGRLEKRILSLFTIYCRKRALCFFQLIRRAISQIYYLDRKWVVHTGCQSVDSYIFLERVNHQTKPEIGLSAFNLCNAQFYTVKLLKQTTRF